MKYSFGEIKSIIEKELSDSYSNKDSFKRNFRKVGKYIKENKDFAYMWKLYSDLQKPSGMSKEDAALFMEESIKAIKSCSGKIDHKKVPFVGNGKRINSYKNIDVLVENTRRDIGDLVAGKKEVMSTLMSTDGTMNQEFPNVPIRTLFEVADKNMKKRLSELKESDRKEVMELLELSEETITEQVKDEKQRTLTVIMEKLENTEDTELTEKLILVRDKMMSEGEDVISLVRLRELHRMLMSEQS